MAYRLLAATVLPGRKPWPSEDIEQDGESAETVINYLTRDRVQACLVGEPAACAKLRELLSGSRLAKILFIRYVLGKLDNSDKLLKAIEPVVAYSHDRLVMPSVLTNAAIVRAAALPLFQIDSAIVTNAKRSQPVSAAVEFLALTNRLL